MENIKFSRRAFIAALSGAGLGLALPSALLRASPAAVIRKPIPSSGELLPVIGLGTSRTFDVATDNPLRAQLVDVLQAFFDQGGALIDSSPMYGHAESVVGELLQKVSGRDALFAATKVWTWGKEDGIKQMERSMQRMGVKRFDLMQIHNLRDWEVHLETLRDWKKAGKIRYLGITTSHGRSHDELEVILENVPFDFVQLSYSIGNRAVEQRLLPIAAERRIAVLANRPFQRGELFSAVKGKSLPDWAADIGCTSWAQFFLKYVVSHPAVTCAIPATSKVRHMLDNMWANLGRLPDAEMRKRMEQYFESL